MRLLRPIPRAVSRPLSFVVLVAWALQMGVLLRSIQASSMNLATDLSRYGSAATWKGVYSRGEKIGFTVSQTLPRDDGFELQEDGRLQMVLLGATTAARLHTTARVDKEFELRSFEFSLDPGTGPLLVEGTLDGLRLTLTVKTPGGTRTETRTSPSRRPSRSTSRGGSRRPASAPDSASRVVFDPATLRNAPVTVEVGAGGRARAGSADPRVPGRDLVRRGALHVVGDRHRRGRPRGEPARLHRREARAGSGRPPSPSPARSRPTCSRPPPSCPRLREAIDEPAGGPAPRGGSRGRGPVRPRRPGGRTDRRRAPRRDPRSGDPRPGAGGYPTSRASCGRSRSSRATRRRSWPRPGRRRRRRASRAPAPSGSRAT